MKKKVLKSSTLVFLLSVFCLPLMMSSVLFAADPERSEKGIVKSVTDKEIVVTEYDRDKNAEVQVTYSITPDTRAEIYGDIPVSQVKEGDEIEVDYNASGGKRIAEFVSVDLSSYE